MSSEVFLPQNDTKRVYELDTHYNIIAVKVKNIPPLVDWETNFYCHLKSVKSRLPCLTLRRVCICTLLIKSCSAI